MAIDRRATRLGVLGMVGVILISLLGVRLWFLQTVQSEALAEITQGAQRRTIRIAPERGRIFDADGRILADNERILTVGVDWQMLRKEDQRTELFTRLSGWVGVPVETMEERFQKGIDSPFLPFPIKQGIDEQTAIAILERVEDFPGVEVYTEWKRVYPYAPHAAHVIGYMGAITEEQLDDYLKLGYLRNERVGQFGVELSYEEVLHGTWGTRVIEVDAANRPLRVVEEVPPVNGLDIQLTIDLDVQQYAEQVLETTLRARRTQTVNNPKVKNPFTGRKEWMDKNSPPTMAFKAPAGSVIVMNYATGEIVAMASYPTYDNRWFEAGLSSTKFKEIFPPTDDPDKSILVNRAVQGRYNVGSTFKPFVAYAAMDSGLLTAGDYYTDTGVYELSSAAVSDRSRCESGMVRCVYKNAICSFNGRPCVYGSVNVESALAVSSDAFFYRIGDLIMTENDFDPVLQDEVKLFGFGADTGIDLPYEFDGVVPDADVKREYARLRVISDDEGRGYFVADNVQLAIGQGLLSSTPLHLTNGYATLANGGAVLEPRVLKAVWAPGVPDLTSGIADLEAGELAGEQPERTVVRQILLPDEIRNPIVRGLRRVITGPGANGRSTTGESLFSTYPAGAIQIAGKTGTAQGANSFPWNDSSVFTGFALNPANLGPDLENPYVVTAYLEKSGFGAQAAGPVVKCVFMALSGAVAMDPVEISEPLDITATTAAPRQELKDTRCWVGKMSNPVLSGRGGTVE